MTAAAGARPARKPLPFWAKAVATLVVLTVAAIISGAFGVFYYSQILSRESRDPQYIKAAAAKVAEFPQPLPSGYEMRNAVNLDWIHLAMVAIMHDADHQMISILSMNSPAAEDAKVMLDSSYRAGINVGYYAAKFQEIKSKGTETIAGQEMQYIVGRFIDSAGRSGDGLVACIVIKKLSKNILIYAFPMGDTPYNLETSLTLIRSIKGF